MKSLLDAENEIANLDILFCCQQDYLILMNPLL